MVEKTGSAEAPANEPARMRGTDFSGIEERLAALASGRMEWGPLNPRLVPDLGSKEGVREADPRLSQALVDAAAGLGALDVLKYASANGIDGIAKFAVSVCARPGTTFWEVVEFAASHGATPAAELAIDMLAKENRWAAIEDAAFYGREAAARYAIDAATHAGKRDIVVLVASHGEEAISAYARKKIRYIL